MTRQEFLQELRAALQGEVSQVAQNEHVKYYENYIIEESRKGKSEQEVIRQLGNPRLIAKTLIDTTEQFGPSAGERYDSQDYNQEESSRGFQADYSKERGWDVRFGKFRLNSWYGKLLLIVLAVLIIAVVASVVAFLLPIILVVMLVLFAISLFLGRRR